MNFVQKTLTLILFASFIVFQPFNTAFAQCSASSAPVYSNTCTSDYYTSITASGTGVISTISLTGTSCTGITWFNDYTAQGISVPAGAAVNLNISRAATFMGYISVYIDWNNNGTYETTELAGTMLTLPVTTLSTVYSFTVPATGVVTGTNLHMRVMLSELATGAPCTANWGQSADFYCNVTCPATGISVSSRAVPVCSGDTMALTASGAATYTWAPSAGLSATTGATVTDTPSVTTTYTVTGITSITSIGCSGTSTVTVTVNPSPSVAVTASGALTFCPGDSVTLTAPAGNSYLWYKNDTAIPGATNAAFTDTTSGSYKVAAVNSYGCSDTSAALNVNDTPLVPHITFSAGIFRTGNYYTSYQWYENGVLITGATHDTVIAHSNGSYTVKVTDTTGCSGTSAIYVLTHLAVSAISNNSGIRIYPNPANNMLYIESPAKVNAVITGIDGKIAAEQQDAKNIDLSALPAGAYSIELFDKNGNELTVQKIIKN